MANRCISAAKAAGVRRLVQLSGVGADPNMCCARMLRWYGQAEVTVAATGLDITRLRPTNLLQNLFGEGVLSASFIPVYASLRARGREREDAEEKRHGVK